MPRGLNWDTRAQLMSSAQPGKTIQQTFLIQPPAEPGLYQVQVSMVQEQVMWLHDHGLEIAGAETWIAVAADGAVRLVTPEELELPAAAE